MMNKTAPKQAVKQAVQDLRKKLGNVGITPKPGMGEKFKDPYGRNPTPAEMPPKPGMGTPNTPTSDFEPMSAVPEANMPPAPTTGIAYRRGGAVRNKPQTKFASGGSVGGASRRGDGIAQRGKTKGRMC